ncbi:MAG: GNAT family N-acetyltransferase [Bacilli bacterium]
MIKQISLNDEKTFYELGLRLKANFKDLYDLKVLLSSDYNFIFGYYKDGVLSAFLHLSKSFEVVDIVNIVVAKKHEREGIASILLNYAFKYFKDVDKFILEVNVNNLSAINLYKKNGFTIISKREKYYDGVDAYIMERCE